MTKEDFESQFNNWLRKQGNRPYEDALGLGWEDDEEAQQQLKKWLFEAYFIGCMETVVE